MFSNPLGRARDSRRTAQSSSDRLRLRLRLCRYEVLIRTPVENNKCRIHLLSFRRNFGHIPYISPAPADCFLNPFRTAVSFWGHLGINYLEFECLVPKTELEF